MFNSWRAKRRIQKLIQSWQVYRQVVTDAQAGEPLAPDAEDSFLELKAEIAGQLQSLTEILPPSATVEAGSHISGMTGLLQNQLTLRPPADDLEWDQERFSRAWQLHFLYLNKLKSMRLDRQRSRVDPNMPVPSGFPGMESSRKISSGKVPRFVWFGLILILLLGLGYWGFGVRWDGEDKLVIQEQSHLGQSAGGILASINAWWSGVVSFFSPVILAYGSIVSLVLFGVLLLSLGYWVFIHS